MLPLAIGVDLIILPGPQVGRACMACMHGVACMACMALHACKTMQARMHAALSA
jgi:hypothetical protein